MADSTTSTAAVGQVSSMTAGTSSNPDIEELIENNPELKAVDERMQALFQKFRQDLEPLIENCFAQLHKITDFVGARRGETLPPWSEAKKAMGIFGMSESDKKELKELQDLEDAEHKNYTRELLGE
ncbi:hypothetical protein LTR17_012525 [Elasticomyces elasticus]|nr:hypothetical protein LTR17_012525 [Elasticomyces elasticus]